MKLKRVATLSCQLKSVVLSTFFIFSSLPDIVKTTGGWGFLNIHHMNNKYAIEQIAR